MFLVLVAFQMRCWFLRLDAPTLFYLNIILQVFDGFFVEFAAFLVDFVVFSRVFVDFGCIFVGFRVFFRGVSWFSLYYPTINMYLAYLLNIWSN